MMLISEWKLHFDNIQQTWKTKCYLNTILLTIQSKPMDYAHDYLHILNHSMADSLTFLTSASMYKSVRHFKVISL